MLQVALDKANIEVEQYYSSEIDKNAIAVSSYNFPNHIRLGDLTKLTNETLDSIKPIDLVVFGSPCKTLSIANSNRSTGKDGVITGESAIFYDCLRIMQYLKPKYFIMENVASATKECQDIISNLIGVKPILLDASWFSPQMRKRLFWTNIPNVTQPLTKDTSVLKDILETNVDVKYHMMTQQQITWLPNRQPEDIRLGYVEKPFNPGCSKYSPSQGTRILNIETKTTCIPSMPWGVDWIKDKIIRKLTPVECCRLMGLKDTYCDYGNYDNKIKQIRNIRC